MNTSNIEWQAATLSGADASVASNFEVLEHRAFAAPYPFMYLCWQLVFIDVNGCSWALLQLTKYPRHPGLTRDYPYGD